MPSDPEVSDPEGTIALIPQSPLVRAALDALAEGLMLANPGGRIIYSNPAADRILGVRPADDTSEGWAEHYGIVDPETQEPFPADQFTLVRALRGEETDDVEMLVRNDAHGEDIYIFASGRPVRNAEGEIIGVVTIIRDITEIRSVEAGHRKALESLEKAQHQKRELTGFLIHDMKSPLSTILANSDLVLLSDGLDDEDQDSLSDIQEAAQTLHRMVMNLLDIQAAEDGHLDPEVEPLDALSMLQEVATSFRARTGMEAITVQGPEDAATVDALADPEMLRRIVTNLMDNCIKYGPDDGRIWLQAERRGDGMVRISVSDEGPGVPEGLRDAIFERYATVERHDEGRHPGSRGLGLRFCKLAAEAHGGRLWVEDNEPKGARFCFELPTAARTS